MKINFGLILFVAALVVVMAMGMALLISFRSSGISFDPNMRTLESQGIENYACYDPIAVNPYQAGNSDRQQAAMVTAFVSYILKEVKSFTMFTAFLAVLALTVYVLIVYIVMKNIAKPTVNQAETRKDISENENYNNKNSCGTQGDKCAETSHDASVTVNNDVMGHVNDSSKLSEYIAEQSSETLLLSLIIDKMLEDIVSVTERSGVKQRVLLN
ncbi:MAG: hypothetical protein LBU85_08710 [Treponema sp.]|jgi:cell division protein FtsL|nr:hypothetical protein [Treponema sp.]